MLNKNKNSVPYNSVINKLPYLRARTAIAELQKAMLPYLFYWEEWAASESCNLNNTEVAFINTLIDNDFNFEFYDYFMPEGKIIFLRRIRWRLDLGYPVFREFVITKFLLKVLDLGRQYGNEQFFELPLYWLNISDSLKTVFKSFGTHSVRQLFLTYSARQLNSEWIYEKIVRFHLLMKSDETLITHKTRPSMKKNR